MTAGAGASAASGFDLPRWVYSPGDARGADEAVLEAAKATVPIRFAAAPSVDQPALRYGHELYAAGFFWEAHEVLEAVWMATPQNGADRLALRAVIQLANAGLKIRMGRGAAALRLLREVGELLGEVEARRPARGFAASLHSAALHCAAEHLGEQVRAGDAAPAMPPISVATTCTKLHVDALSGWTAPQ